MSNSWAKTNSTTYIFNRLVYKLGVVFSKFVCAFRFLTTHCSVWMRKRRKRVVAAALYIFMTFKVGT